MPSTLAWKGDAVAVAQVITVTVGGTVEADDLFIVTMGDKVLSVPAGATNTTTVATTIKTAWNALAAATYPEFAEITATSSAADVILTCDTAGTGFSITPSTTEAGGGAADDQTWVQVATTAVAGANVWSTAANWGAAAAPATNDTVVLENSDIDILYGLDQSAVTLAALRVEDSYTGAVGLPRENNVAAYPYIEYRQRYLYIGATIVDLRTAGTRFMLDNYNIQTAVTVNSAGTSADATVPCILWKGTHAANTLTVNKGDVGVAIYAGETAVIATLTVGYVASQSSDATVECGSGVTLTTINQSGGTLTIESAATTITMSGGTLYIEGTAAYTTLTMYEGTVYYGSTGTLTTLNVYGGTFYHSSTGTITNLNISDGGTFDCRRTRVARTVTNATITKGSSIYDPSKSVTWSNGVDLSLCGLADVTLEIGEHLTVTPTAI